MTGQQVQSKLFAGQVFGNLVPSSLKAINHFECGSTEELDRIDNVSDHFEGL